MQKTFWPLLLLIFGLIGCVAQNKGQESKANCPEFYQFDTVTRKCFLGAKTPIGTLKTVSMLEDTPKTVALTYINPQGNPSVSCAVTNDTPTKFTLGSCDCVGGTCEVTINPVLNEYGTGGFKYTVTDSVGETSVQSVVAVTIAPVNDAPIAFNQVVNILDQDTYNVATNTFPNTTAFTIPLAFDVDNDANTLTYSLVAGQTLRGTLTGCLNGTTTRTCTYVVDESQLDGTTEIIYYRAHDGELYSNIGSLQMVYPNKSTSDDAPRIRLTSKNLTITEEQERVYDFLYGTDYVDAEGDLATSCEVIAASGVRQTQNCTCDLTGKCSVTMRGNVGVTGSGHYFTYRVFTGAVASTNSGTVNLTITATTKPPFPISKDVVALESSNALAAPFAVTLDAAIPTSSTTTTYELVRAPDPLTEGTLSGCVSGTVLTNLNCTFTPVNGNINDFGGTRAQTVPIGNGLGTAELVFESKFIGAAANDIYLDLVADLGNQAFISSVPIVTVEPLVSGTPSSEVVIKIRFQSGVTTVGQIVNAITSNANANALINVSIHSGLATATWSSATAGPSQLLGGGSNPTSYITYKARRGSLDSIYHATVSLSITPVNDDPVVCAYSKYQGDAALSNVMPTAHECGLEGCIRNTSPTIAGIIPTRTDLIFFDAQNGICYKSTGTSSINDWQIISSSSQYIPTVTINEKDKVIISGIKFDEGGGPGHESGQSLTLTNLTSSNPILVPTANISFLYKTSSATVYTSIADPSTFDFGNGILSAGERDYRIDIIPVGTLSGTSTISFTLTDNDLTDPKSTTVSFNVVVNPLSAQHSGWKTLKAVGAKTDKFGQIFDVPNSCQHSIARCNGGKDCLGSARSAFVPDGDNAVFFETTSSKCYYSQGGSWTEFASICNISPSVLEPSCKTEGLGESCIGTGAPNFVPLYTESYYYDRQNNHCYRSTGTGLISDWRRYTAPSTVTVAWEDFSVSGTGTISGYNVYRKVVGQEFNYNIPINKTRISASTKTYIDNNVNSRFAPVPGTVYYYEVKPVVNQYPTQTNETFKTARVVAPFVNTAFVHRWMANKMLCQKMNRTTDPFNNFRCSYRGPGEIAGGFYDIGKDLIVDRFETGCNYSNTGCNTIDGACIGVDNPAGLITSSPAGGIYYSRSSGQCFRHTGGTTWQGINASVVAVASRTGNERANVSRLPPITGITKAAATSFCSNSSDAIADGIFGTNGLYSGSKTLPTRKDQVAYSFWDTDTLTSTAINTREAGLSLNAVSKCNSSFASGLEAGYTDSETPDSNNLYSLPGTSSSNIRSVVTGSTQTALCESRFGVQDAIGNVTEWLDETLSCDVVGGENVCSDVSGNLSLVTADSDATSGFSDNFGAYAFNGDIGVCPFDGSGLCYQPTIALAPLIFQEKSFSGGRMFLPLGLPVRVDYVTKYPDSDLVSSMLMIGSTAGITNADLHNDSFNLNYHALTFNGANNTGMVAGGGYKDGSGAGVYHFQLLPLTSTQDDIGLRCKVDIAPSFYLE